MTTMLYRTLPINHDFHHLQYMKPIIKNKDVTRKKYRIYGIFMLLYGTVTKYQLKIKGMYRYEYQILPILKYQDP